MLETDLIAFLQMPFMEKPVYAWLAFLVMVMVILAFDLGVLQRKAHEVSAKESLKLCISYFLIACAYGGWIWQRMGAENGMDFYTGYLIEFTLSLDNIFVISLIFTYFGVPRILQHRVLFWGILGAIVLRGIMISLGAGLIHKFEWILTLFALFLVFSGIKILFAREAEEGMTENFVIRQFRKHFRVTSDFHGEHFFVRLPDPVHAGKIHTYATPMFLCLIMVELSDVVFAVDSVPAIFVITQEAFIVYTSNIFAILGLRSLYFLLAAAVHRFQYLKQAMGLILVFIGAKIFLVPVVGKIPSAVSLSVTLTLILGGIGLSLYKNRGQSAEK